MVHSHRVLPCLLAVAAGLAPPVVIPPAVVPQAVRPATLPAASVASQAQGSYAGFAEAPMSVAGATSYPAPNLWGQEPMPRTVSDNGKSMEILTDSEKVFYPSPETGAWSSRLPDAKITHAPTASSTALIGVFMLAAISAAAGVRWWDRRTAALGQKQPATEMMAVAALSSERVEGKVGRFDPLCLRKDGVGGSKTSDCEVNHGRQALMMVAMAEGSIPAAASGSTAKVSQGAQARVASLAVAGLAPALIAQPAFADNPSPPGWPYLIVFFGLFTAIFVVPNVLFKGK